ncbi:AAA family ATPase [Patescibacteria group bacterium]|nr:AAA family ATPase [Patescibacteria group bacterium]
MGKVVGIISLKGGVGKTSSVVSLGSAISDFGKKVLLIDGNLSSPNLGLHLNIIEPEKTLHHVLARKADVSEAIYNHENFHIMPASIFEKIDVNPLQLKNRIASLKKKYDVILLDSSPSLDEETLAVILASDELIVVTTPDHPTLSATIKAINLAKQRGTPLSGLILNKVHHKNFEISFAGVEDTLDVPILAVIPYDKNMLKSLSNMTPYTRHKPGSRGSIEYKKLAAALIEEKYHSDSIRNLFRSITPSRQEINREIFYKRFFGE